ncbi:beta-glucosidase 16 [Cucumis melo var. makuwa]|uniref:Beta-glucosidase 16 n=1 Tax=Cucumis melo var. makuwa TaxID=1194695 RepID=A0A5A7TPW8_CUCMM|nr:beta-glucosidase 16 [Cucumis melo var. makuwa]TYK19248.1 beta-glucosidase 16 [Cucumis melo var. makuwa]
MIWERESECGKNLYMGKTMGEGVEKGMAFWICRSNSDIAILIMTSISLYPRGICFVSYCFVEMKKRMSEMRNLVLCLNGQQLYYSFYNLISYEVAVQLDMLCTFVEDRIEGSMYSCRNERDTVVCFFDFQEIKESPRKIQKPVVDFLVSRHDARSVSLKACSWKDLDGLMRKPCPGNCGLWDDEILKENFLCCGERYDGGLDALVDRRKAIGSFLSVLLCCPFSVQLELFVVDNEDISAFVPSFCGGISMLLISVRVLEAVDCNPKNSKDFGSTKSGNGLMTSSWMVMEIHSSVDFSDGSDVLGDNREFCSSDPWCSQKDCNEYRQSVLSSLGFNPDLAEFFAKSAVACTEGSFVA